MVVTKACEETIEDRIVDVVLTIRITRTSLDIDKLGIVVLLVPTNVKTEHCKLYMTQKSTQ